MIISTLLLAEFPIHLERPGWLLLLLLVIPVAWLSRRSIGSVSRGKANAAVFFRALVILLLAIALSHPAWVKRGRGLTLAMVVDVSQSIPPALRKSSEQYLREVAKSKEKSEDRLAVVSVAKGTDIPVMPDAFATVAISTQGLDLTATNLAMGLRTAQSILPQDTANRILLVSDGNETVENVMAEAEIARANGIPIDVLPLEYEHRAEVLIESIRAPTRARVGQSADLRIFVRSQSTVGGSLFLWRNDIPVDLDPEADGDALRVELEAGPNTLVVPISFDNAGTHRFRAVFEPDVPAEGEAPRDTVAENNVGMAVTFVGGEGRLLIIHGDENESAPIVAALRRRGLDVDAIGADDFTGSLTQLNGYDAVMLVNVPRWALNIEADPALHAYVHDLGGGLAMIGGPESFGAGGWIDTDVAKALPVELDPPQTRQMPRGALALIMHSCEMPQGNFWGQEVARAAIEALSRLDYVGIVSFNYMMGGGGGAINGSSWAFPMQIAGDKSAALAATKKMVVGDMPDFDSSMRVALEGLMKVNAGQRHSIIISDGDPAFSSRPLLEEFIANKITITTVMVAGHGTQQDLDKMNTIAGLTGGRFYNVTNPRNLPQIFVKEAQLVARSLIVEGAFAPTFASRLPGPGTRFSAVPGVQGYVLTAPRQGLVQTPLVNKTTEADDPIFAYWNYGLGKAIAFTPDLTGRWSPAWLGWSAFGDYWEETSRWMMRPPTPPNITLRTSTEGDKAIVELEALDDKTSFVNFLRTDARVLKPDATVGMLSLQQTGPGKYRGEFPIDEAGAYLVNVAFAGGGSDGRGTSGSVQAAVAVPYSREFREMRDNLKLLKDIAERTGGRVMSMNDPSLANYFDRTGLEVPSSAKRIWDLLAILAAAVFLLDVALRRIAIEPEAVAGALRRLARPRGEAGEATMAAWKRARQQADRRAPVSADAPIGLDASVRQRKFEVEAGASAIDVAAETASTGESRPSRTPGPVAAGEPEAAQGEGDYTSRLLKAKRRVQDERGDEQPPPVGGAGG